MSFIVGHALPPGPFDDLLVCMRCGAIHKGHHSCATTVDLAIASARLSVMHAVGGAGLVEQAAIVADIANKLEAKAGKP